MKTKLLLCAMLTLPTTTWAQEKCPYLSIQQLHTMQEVFDYGKQHNLEYTLTAISWVESRAGEVLVGINPNTGNDYGPLQLNIKTAANLEGIEGGYKKNILASKLVTDVQYSAKLAAKTFLWWYDYHDKDWSKAAMSYNRGFNYQAGEGYKEKVVDSIRMLKHCVKL